MKIGYNPVVAVVVIVIGLFNLLLGLLLAPSGNFNGSLVLGPVFTLIGILALGRPYFLFDAATGTVVVKALLGPYARKFGGAAGGRLIVTDNRIVHLRSDGSTKKVPVLRFVSNTQAWQSVVATICGQAAR